MELAPHHTMDQLIAGTLSWWHQAGVDCAFGDEAVAWLEPLAEVADSEGEPQNNATGSGLRTAPPPAALDLPKIGGDNAGWPQDLAAFDIWWMNEASLETGSTAKRVAPRGPANADLLVLVEQPDVADTGILLSGEQGSIVSAMLSAMAIAPENVRFASVLPRHTPMADWAGLQTGGMAEVLAHHLRLAAPRRIMSFGSNIPPLLGNDPAQSAQILRTINQDGRTIPVLAERSLDALMRRKAKAGFWQRWLDWTRV